MQDQGTAFTPPCPSDHINTAIWDFGHFIHTTNSPVGWDRGVWASRTPGQSAIQAFPWQLLSILFFSYFDAFVKLRQDGNQEAIGADEKLQKEHDRFRLSQAFTVTVAFTTMLIASVDEAIDETFFCLTCRNKHGTRKAETRAKPFIKNSEILNWFRSRSHLRLPAAGWGAVQGVFPLSTGSSDIRDSEQPLVNRRWMDGVKFSTEGKFF